MTNYEGILKMSQKQLERLLDGVYCTGLNNGMYALRLSEEEAASLLEKNPFNEAWLREPAEKAVLQKSTKKEDEYLLDALATAIFNNAGIDTDPKDFDETKNCIVF